jgi:transcriptional antiterminator
MRQAVTDTSKAEYHRQVKNRLDAWEMDFDELQTRIRLSDATLRNQRENYLQKLRDRKQDLLRKLQETQTSAGEDWDRKREATDRALASFQQTIEEARTELRA